MTDDPSAIANIIVLIIGALSTLIGGIATAITSTRSARNDETRARTEAERGDADTAEKLHQISISMLREIKEELHDCKTAKADMQAKFDMAMAENRGMQVEIMNLKARIEELEKALESISAQKKRRQRKPKTESQSEDAEQ